MKTLVLIEAMAGIPPSRVDPLELEGEVKSAGDRDRAEEIFQKEGLGGRIGLVESITN